MSNLKLVQPTPQIVHHPRPFAVFYGEGRNTQHDIINYHARSRCSTLTGALRAAITRIHLRRDSVRADFYDLAGIYMGYLRRDLRADGYQIYLTSFAWTQTKVERKLLGFL